jgi:hypothetical protein
MVPAIGEGEIVLHFHGFKHDDRLASRDGGSHLHGQHLAVCEFGHRASLAKPSSLRNE